MVSVSIDKDLRRNRRGSSAVRTWDDLHEVAYSWSDGSDNVFRLFVVAEESRSNKRSTQK